jgi:hypothetical protein
MRRKDSLKILGKRYDPAGLARNKSRPQAGDFPLGSLESRAAARAMAEDKDEGIILTLEGMPTPYPG